jgi:hypothetical protein
MNLPVILCRSSYGDDRLIVALVDYPSVAYGDSSPDKGSLPTFSFSFSPPSDFPFFLSLPLRREVAARNEQTEGEIANC